MIDALALKRQLLAHEGERLKPYVDTAGKITIGVGRNLTDRGITADESALLFSNDIVTATASLDAQLPWWRDLDDVRSRVLADMCFNMGIGTLLTFATFLSEVRQGNYAAAAADLTTTLWHRQVGWRALRLEQMMESGQDVPPGQS